MIIKYDTHGTYTTSYTSCPHGKYPHVGSAGCSDCEFHKGMNDIQEEVDCGYPETLSELPLS